MSRSNARVSGFSGVAGRLAGMLRRIADIVSCSDPSKTPGKHAATDYTARTRTRSTTTASVIQQSAQGASD